MMFFGFLLLLFFRSLFVIMSTLTRRVAQVLGTGEREVVSSHIECTQSSFYFPNEEEEKCCSFRPDSILLVELFCAILERQIFCFMRCVVCPKKKHTHNKIPPEGSCAVFPFTPYPLLFLLLPLSDCWQSWNKQEKRAKPYFYFFSFHIIDFFLGLLAAAAARRRYMCPWSRRVNFSYSSGFTLRPSQQSRSTSLCVALFCYFGKSICFSIPCLGC